MSSTSRSTLPWRASASPCRVAMSSAVDASILVVRASIWSLTVTRRPTSPSRTAVSWTTRSTYLSQATATRVNAARAPSVALATCVIAWSAASEASPVQPAGAPCAVIHSETSDMVVAVERKAVVTLAAAAVALSSAMAGTCAGTVMVVMACRRSGRRCGRSTPAAAGCARRRRCRPGRRAATRRAAHRRDRWRWSGDA